MFDERLRARVVAPAAGRLARVLLSWNVPAVVVTTVGLALGVAACVVAGFGLWWIALVLWVSGRVCDGVDGPLARLVGSTDLGGFLDFACDLAVYAGFVVAVAFAVPGARLACVALLAMYYVNVGAWLSYSALVERRRLQGGDERSLRFVPGLAEGAETLLVYVLFCLMPEHAAVIAWAFAALVGVSAVQRIVLAARTL